MNTRRHVALRDLPLPHAPGSETSRLAAEQGRPAAPRTRLACLRYVESQGAMGATMAEVEQALSMKHQTVCPRIKELREAGLLVDSGLRRATSSGRAAVVWVRP